jgi:hypothetical protein
LSSTCRVDGLELSQCASQRQRFHARRYWRMLRLRGSRHHALPVQEYSARYCTDYIGDIGLAVDPNPMDFSAWAEVLLDGRWYIIDARHNNPRIGRIVMDRGRDAADVAISTPLGSPSLRALKSSPKCKPNPRRRMNRGLQSDAVTPANGDRPQEKSIAQIAMHAAEP